MYLYKQLSNILFGGEEQKERGESSWFSVQGTLYSLPSAPALSKKSNPTCMFPEAELCLVKGSTAWSYVMVITRVVNDTEELNAEPSGEDEVRISIVDSMALCRETGPLGRMAFGFTDVSTGKRFLFEMETDSPQMEEVLRVSLCQCIFENKYQQPHNISSEAELSTFCAGTVQTTSPVSPDRKEAAKASSFSFPPATDRTVQGTELFESQSSLYIYEESSKEFKHVDEVHTHIHSTGDGKKTFDRQILLAQEISNDMYMYFNKEHKSVIWVTCRASSVWTWSLIFPDSEADQQFKDTFATCLWEKNSGMPFSKVKKEDVDWILESYSDTPSTKMETDDGITEYDMLDFVEENESKQDEDEDEEEEQEDEAVSDDSDEEEQTAEDAKATNSLLSVGYSTDRAFVVRGSQIGVFKNSGKKLKYCTRIKQLKDAGKPFSPKKIMLHQQDSSMLILHPEKQNSVFRMDLTRGDVVEEWKTHEYHPLKDLFPQTKYAQLTPESTVLGMNELGFMTLDPRLPKEKVVDNRSFFYKPSTKPQFTCAITAGSGQLALGSKNGDIRLYSDKMMQQTKKDLEQAPRAKTQLPGFGDPIIGIDVTEDGEWILATCKTYLLVVPTSANDTSGFAKSLGKDKPVPRRLQLKREHIAQMGGKISFTTAHFNVGSDKERSIVTSTGPFVITWNFRKVRQNKLDEYQIREYKDTVVADQFKYGDDKAIVVTLRNDVVLAHKGVKK